jgi:hypothetical protein
LPRVIYGGSLVRRNDFIRHCKLWDYRDGNGTVPPRTTLLGLSTIGRSY